MCGKNVKNEKFTHHAENLNYNESQMRRSLLFSVCNPFLYTHIRVVYQMVKIRKKFDAGSGRVYFGGHLFWRHCLSFHAVVHLCG